jgi:hypothetical protein
VIKVAISTVLPVKQTMKVKLFLQQAVEAHMIPHCLDNRLTDGKLSALRTDRALLPTNIFLHLVLASVKG